MAKFAILYKLDNLLEENMERKFISSTEFRNKAGQFFDEAAKRPVFIRKHAHATRVLMDIDEYERLQAVDKRQSKLASARGDLHGRYGDMLRKLAR